MDKNILTTEKNVNLIIEHIHPIFHDVLNEYDFDKYPAEPYRKFKEAFSAMKIENDCIRDALIWKWGHWGKSNFPKNHYALIEKTQYLWPYFVSGDNGNKSCRTFEWWQKKLVKRTSYITVAYITHLIHHDEYLPIIDQHNYRAMNALMRLVDPDLKAKKKPSNWNDILSLKSFMSLVNKSMPEYSFGEIDRFLMMYGRNHVIR